MNYIKLIRDTWEIFTENKQIWLFGIVSPLYYLSPNKLSSNPLLLCLGLVIMLFIFFLPIFGGAGLIISAVHGIREEKTSLHEIWVTFKANLGQIIFMGFLVGLLMFIPFMCVLFQLSQNQFISWVNIPVIMLMVINELIFPFSIRGILIDNLKAPRSISKSIYLSLDHLGLILFVGFSFIILRQVFFGLVGLLSSGGQVNVFLDLLVSFNLRILVDLIGLPVTNYINYISSVLTSPFESIMFTIMYIKFSEETKQGKVKELFRGF